MILSHSNSKVNGFSMEQISEKRVTFVQSAWLLCSISSKTRKRAAEFKSLLKSSRVLEHNKAFSFCNSCFPRYKSYSCWEITNSFSKVHEQVSVKLVGLLHTCYQQGKVIFHISLARLPCEQRGMSQTSWRVSGLVVKHHGPPSSPRGFRQ